MAGLLAYLQGPGRANEHERPHLVAGDPLLMAWHSTEELSRDDALGVARHLDRPWRAHETDIRSGVYEQRAQAVQGTGEDAREGVGQQVLERVKVGEKSSHVWHCSLSLRAVEGQLDDARWQQIAEAFVDRMGFGGQGQPTREVTDPDGSTRVERNPDYVAGCRWVAVHHGVSAEGNDHVHLAVNLVREDGNAVRLGRDFARARDLCRELETEYGLLPLRPNDYDLARATAQSRWEQGRRVEVEQGVAGGPRIPWVELDEAGQAEQIAGTFEDSEEGRAQHAAAYRARDRHGAGDAVQPRFSYAERAADARRTARGRFEGRRRAGEETRQWDDLGGDERSELYAAAMRDRRPRLDMARTVRACAGASADEAEFVRRMRQEGMLVRPRFAQGSTREVVGYSVAERPPQRGEKPVWFGGGSLGKDLALPRLRDESGWSAGEQVTDGAAEWTAARQGRAPVSDGREVATPDARVWERATQDLQAVREQLRGVSPDNRATWARVARLSAAALAAWSKRVEETPGPLARAADSLGRSASVTRPEQDRTAAQGGTGSHDREVSASGTAYVLMAAQLPGRAAQAAMLRELRNLGQALHQMHQAEGAAHRAEDLERAVRYDLNKVAGQLRPERQQPGHETERRAAVVGPPRRRTVEAQPAHGPRDVRPDKGPDRQGPKPRR